MLEKTAFFEREEKRLKDEMEKQKLEFLAKERAYLKKIQDLKNEIEILNEKVLDLTNYGSTQFIEIKNLNFDIFQLYRDL